ncbi:hypothetical protein Q3V23_22320 [Streptomyces sp. VNUA116]|uniref:hypothetical protein n=1 Tax=Streptomyces sp. VNUA116 TaxID=3062449 RepID=UPI002674A447|nr:hypothetical protein [Streptomyces sp. VNUA116]WKU46568.1 hypothetical protein Q3V23_22320 [Streptomyces sp. VNUA116]
MINERHAESTKLQLIQAVRLLASNPDVQAEYVQRLGVGPDEIALEFDDAFRRAVGAAGMGLLPDEMVKITQPLGEQLQRMTESQEDIWSEVGMMSSTEWGVLRTLATRAMEGISKLTDNPT